MILVIDEWFKEECRQQSNATVEQYMTKLAPLVNVSCHVIHVLGIILQNEIKVLLVIEDNVLQRAVRMEDIFKILATYCAHVPHATTTNILKG